MRIALIFPRTRYPSGQPPLGILYLAAYLRQHVDCEIDVIDPTFESHPMAYMEAALKAKTYDLVGVSVMTTMLNEALFVSRVAKGLAHDPLLVWGGPHPTVMPEQTMSYPEIDAICMGEAEETFLELIRRGGNPQDVAGMWYRADGNVVRNPPRPMITDISRLPFPARDLIPMDDYIRAWYSLTAADPNLTGTSVIGSRGCPYSCTYCQPTLRQLFGRKVRRRSVDDIIAELEHLKVTYDIKAFMFEDDTFIANGGWAYEFCERLRTSGLDLKWGCNVRVDLVKRDLLVAMRDAGLVQMNMGIESGSQRILDEIYHKRITVEQVEQVAVLASELGIRTGGYFMLGAPTETVEEVRRTIAFAARLPIDEAAFNVTTPLPGTTLWEQTKDLIAGDLTQFDYYKAPVYKAGKVMPARNLDLFKKWAYLRFYALTPRRAVRVAWNTLTKAAGLRKLLLRMRRF
ncbi:MAG: radical SAM protein [Chloroflexota bacterium]|nr:radical SAM protein [Chloroflexota bacterium]